MSESVRPTAKHSATDETRAWQSSIDEAITELSAGAERWAGLPIAKRAALIGEVHAATERAAEAWVRAACDIKQIPFDDAYAGEEWISGPYAMLAGAGTLAHSLASLAEGKSPIADDKFGSAPGGRLTVDALPRSLQEGVLMHGFDVKVWLQPGVTAEEARKSAGLGSRAPGESGGVGVVLGAGNITSIAPLDVLYELVAENRVSVLKVNPILDKLTPALSDALAPLIREGYLRIVSGAAEVGGYLTSHPGISHVHITGSAVTHDAIVWGVGEEADERRAADNPKLKAPITSELGGVSPVIIVPGKWSDADLRYQAEHVATMRLHNSGHNCIAAQVVVVSSDWPQRDDFVAELERQMREVRPRPIWYPNGAARIGQAAEAYPNLVRSSNDTRGLVDVAPGGDASVVETTEFFAPVLGVVSLPGTGDEFLAAAVDHVNTSLTGTLGANVIVDPHTKRELGSRFDDRIAQLRYGNIAVNAWTGLGFLTPTASWGAFPGATLKNVESGIGVVHNALLLDGVERTIIEGAFRPFPRSFAGGEFSLFPKPPWFTTARSAAKTGRRLSGYAAGPSWGKLPGIFAAAFRA